MRLLFALFTLVCTFGAMAHADDNEPTRFIVCNQKSFTLYIAVHEVADDSNGNPQSQTRGWYQAEPGQCAYIDMHSQLFSVYVEGLAAPGQRVVYVPNKLPHDLPDDNLCVDAHSSFIYYGYKTVCMGSDGYIFHSWDLYDRPDPWVIR